MSRTTLRLIGGAVLLFNLWLIGTYNISGVPALLMTLGFAGVFEGVVVRSVHQREDEPGDASNDQK